MSERERIDEQQRALREATAEVAWAFVLATLAFLAVAAVGLSVRL